MKIDELISHIEGEIEDKQRRAETADAEITSILDGARGEGRKFLTENESATTDALFKDIDLALAGRRRSEARLAYARKVEAEETERDAKAHETRDSGAPRSNRTASLTIGRNERTYNPDRDHEAGGKPGAAFLLDVGRAFLGDPLAQDRLTRHQREEFTERPRLEQRAVGTGAFTGLVVPQYVTELVAPAVAAMRPFADVCNHHDLPPDGVSVNISRITTATSAALQATENTAVSETNIDDTLLTVNVQTIAGQQTASRQSIERGTLTEETIVQDLLRRYASTLDSTLINQASTGLAPASTSQTYTNATVDTSAIPAAWKQLIQAQNTVETNLLAQAAPSHFVMHPRRWNWFTAAVSSSWPVVAGSNVPPQSWVAQLTNEYGPSVRAILPNGMKVTVDANISTTCLAQATTGGTQDHVYAVAADEMHLWEDPSSAVLIRAEQPAAASLGILYVVYGYVAYTVSRYSSASVVINGTGFAPPSFA